LKAGACLPAVALMLKSAGGLPAHGNQRSESDAGCRFGDPDPDAR
jgi:hypothetical protein